MNTKAMLLHRIHAYDFAILELELYLDTHKTDKKALARREAFMNERAAILKEYESRFGSLVTTKQDVRRNGWSWVNDPWPWEYKESEL